MCNSYCFNAILRKMTLTRRPLNCRHIFLFDAAVIVCKRRGDNYEMKEVIDLHLFKITNNPTSDKENRKVRALAQTRCRLRRFCLTVITTGAMPDSAPLPKILYQTIKKKQKKKKNLDCSKLVSNGLTSPFFHLDKNTCIY